MLTRRTSTPKSPSTKFKLAPKSLTLPKTVARTVINSSEKRLKKRRRNKSFSLSTLSRTCWMSWSMSFIILQTKSQPKKGSLSKMMMKVTKKRRSLKKRGKRRIMERAKNARKVKTTGSKMNSTCMSKRRF